MDNSRVLKFRAWDKEEKKMWFPSAVASDGRNIALVNQFGVETTDIQKDPVMQFTGLKDKNGKEIYEGDIVSCEQMQGYDFKVIGVVHYASERSEWHIPKGFTVDARYYLDTRPFEKDGSEYCCFHVNPEVIGNIYSNPELLKEME